MQKKKIPSELAYVLAVLLLSFAVALAAAADFGVSMIVAPAYILSLRLGVLTFGQCEYIVQGCLFAVFCLLMRRVKAVYFFSFFTCLFYGAVLDAWRRFVPALDPAVTPPGSQPMALRVAMLAAGILLTALAVAMFYRTYLYPQVYDFFVKGVSTRYHLPLGRFKIAFDFSCLGVACLMTLLLFRRFEGIGIGTLVMTCLNGLLISAAGSLLDRAFVFVPLAEKFSRRFALDES